MYASQGELVTDGVYRHVRHPQYTGIFIITLGFMIQWPTLATLVLWPFVIWMYVRLARREERDVLEQHPAAYRGRYMERTPMFSRTRSDGGTRASEEGRKGKCTVAGLTCTRCCIPYGGIGIQGVATMAKAKWCRDVRRRA